eukprot:gnl/MRDRNA2_/MRDRNA2_31366_c0_seq1.p1 gnl/MRDRNA2_/MRDRNA2_31366_c0~~gnl/MRDRNA2_/MRDRNA2_31366_c0_seq1.p1  ORF type:complete len:703 (+),score=134.33 gnl/MRDRNA2_/MRDRNA2_31366_c0_seq1:51-2159(+)
MPPTATNTPDLPPLRITDRGTSHHMGLSARARLDIHSVSSQGVSNPGLQGLSGPTPASRISSARATPIASSARATMVQTPRLDPITGASSDVGISRQRSHRRFDPNLHLWDLIDVVDLDGGYDWRFIDANQWITIKEKMIELSKQGDDDDAKSTLSEFELAHFSMPKPDAPAEHNIVHRKRIWAHLTTCLIHGTRQAIEADAYPLIEMENGDRSSVFQLGGDRSSFSKKKSAKKRNRDIQIQWVDLGKYRRQLLRMSFFGAFGEVRHRLPNPVPVVKNDDEDLPPVVCCALSPLDAVLAVDRHRRKNFEEGELPSIIVTLDVDLKDATSADGRGCPSIYQQRRPVAEGPCLEGFFMRSDAEAFIKEATKRLAVSSSSSLGDHFTDLHNPYILYCEDLALFRQGSSKGYAFLEAPVILDMVLYSMPYSRPPVRKLNNHSEFRAAIPGLPPEKGYATEEDEKALLHRLTLLADSALKTNRDHSERPKVQPPILVLALPGCLDDQSHPVGGVASMIKKLRKSHVKEFSTIVVACGEDRMVTKQVDAIVNKDLYDIPGDIINSFKEASWNPCTKSLLLSLSVNAAWGGPVKLWRRDTFLEHLQAKEQLRHLEEALASGVSRARRETISEKAKTDPNTGQDQRQGEKIAQLLRDERHRMAQVRAEAQLSKDVRRLAEDFMRSPTTDVSIKGPSTLRSGACWGWHKLT